MNLNQNETFYIGVDVGTGSARAALLNSKGKVNRICTKEIQTWNVKPNYYEQSSANIWNSCVYCIKEVTKDVDDVEKIKGIGFDATCSLVVLDKNGQSLSVDPNTRDNNEQNIILWMDHRASQEADFINQTCHDVLKYVGGKVSLEMEMPKVLWLKNNLPEESWNNIGHLFDLPDFLTWKATNSKSRSLCSLVCKWNYICNETSQGWNADFLNQIGLAGLAANNYELIGNTIQSPGSPIANGLSPKAAKELGLPAGTPVGTSIIDAHAGGLGLFYCRAGCENFSCEPEKRLAMICGTSTCHMANSKRAVFASGIWGPYFNAMAPGFWLNEGGQSATGKLIDHIIDGHPATPGITASKLNKDLNIHQYLCNVLTALQRRQNIDHVDLLAKDSHIWPDFHGNRSPLADPALTGMICGLKLSNSEDDLALLYLATIQALAYGTRHIMEALTSSGYAAFEAITICGGLSKSPVFVCTHANALGVPIVCPSEPESVLVGAAMLGALAAGSTDIEAMAGNGSLVVPNGETKEYHEKKYKVFKMMLEHQMAYKKVMDDDWENKKNIY